MSTDGIVPSVVSQQNSDPSGSRGSASSSSGAADGWDGATEWDTGDEWDSATGWHGSTGWRPGDEWSGSGQAGAWDEDDGWDDADPEDDVEDMVDSEGDPAEDTAEPSDDAGDAPPPPLPVRIPAATLGVTGSGGTPPVSTVGRHARRDDRPTMPRPPRLDYVPRHSVSRTGPDSVSLTDVTEVLSRVREDPTERPRPARPESTPTAPTDPGEPEESVAEDGAPAPDDSESEPIMSGKRVRVVLSQRKGQARPVRTVVDVQELTQVGEVLSSSLIRSQFTLALRIGGIALLGLGVLPAAFYLIPDLGRFELFGVRLPWLLLGGLAYPFMILLGWMYSRSSEKVEQIFADHIQS